MTATHRVVPALCAAALVLLAAVAGPARCQVSEGDEQFEFQHQDIGRISGLSSGAPQVAPQTTIVARPAHQPPQQVFAPEQPATSPLPVASPSGVAPSHHQHQHQHRQRGPAQGSQRKPNRITLVPRRDPLPSLVESQPQPAASLVAAQLPAPPQQSQYAPAPTVASPLVAELPAPTFAPLAVQQPQPQPQLTLHQQHQQQAVGPALSAFRATGGSVSARHSALIAQVAAERAAATATPSFGSPAEALSSPQAVAVAAHTQHQHPHQQQAHAHAHAHTPAAQQLQPAFASFTQQQQQQPLQFQTQQPQPPPQQQQQLQPLLAASQPAGFVNQPEEPLVAPSFEQVLGQGCPQKGVFSWENRDHCDRYYMCTNGTFTEEACPNGLAYSQQGAVYQHCAYNWNVNCGTKKTPEPIASPGCPWQFGIFPIVQAGRCSIDYFACEWGVPDTKRCSPEGLFYDDRIKGCQWADQLGCKSEALLNFKCPPEDEDNQFWPFPRYYHSTKDVIVCVNEQPRLVHCTEDQLVDPSSLACMEINKKKQKF